MHEHGIELGNSDNYSNTNHASSSIVLQNRRSSSSSLSIFNLDGYSRSIQFIILTCGVFLFFGIHNLMQEALMKTPGFGTFGIMLGYFEVLGVTICSYIERAYITKEAGQPMKAPLKSYSMLTLLLLLSSSLSNLSLNYINFPTKVVFRSCKLIPTMIFASVMNRKVFHMIEYGCAICICIGLICFTMGDYMANSTKAAISVGGVAAELMQEQEHHHRRLGNTTENDIVNNNHNHTFIGIMLVLLSICADAILPNYQENIFSAPYHASRLEVTFYTNILTLIAMTCTTLLSGDLIAVVKTCIYAPNNARIIQLLFMYTFIAYLAISFHMENVKRFGGVVAVLVSTLRKGLTLILSFVLFPKIFSIYYVYGALCVLSGITVSSIHKVRSKQPQNKQQQQENNQHDGAIVVNLIQDTEEAKER